MSRENRETSRDPERIAGVLLHPTSLPGRFGIGELGDEAFAFVDFLQDVGCRLWQVLPLGPTGYGDSPYQCFSAFAGNPLLISLELLGRDGWLAAADLVNAPTFPERETDFGSVIAFKFPLLRKAHERFEAQAANEQRREFDLFCAREASWLDDYALFMALKGATGNRRWNTWAPDVAARRPEALEKALHSHAGEIATQKFWQFQFARQWADLRARCHERDIHIMGDVPIFVAHDSADVWAHPELFFLASDGSPAVIAGVPPDYFSTTGQCWGNPLYRWDVAARTGYAWWIERLRGTLSQVDLVRLDHFRGFEAYWEIPGHEKTAVNGRWVPGPGAALFEALQASLGPLPLVAEDLGVITPEVEALRERFGFPGMAILQFAFGTDPQGSGFRPHNYSRRLVAYTGTHDNDTTVGWFNSGVGDTTRSAEDVEKERAVCLGYLGTEGREIHWDFVRTVLASVADTAVVPLQDLLGLGSEARMNLPGRPAGNWRWRFQSEHMTQDLRDRLRMMNMLYGRMPRRS